jgi:hypothetical protein
MAEATGRHWQANGTLIWKSTTNLSRRVPMQDVLWTAVTIVFFAASVAYVRFCDRMK